MFVGWDWASTTHAVTVIDEAGTVVDHWTPPHTEAGLADTLLRLTRHGRPDELPVAIEQSSGLIVERLLAAGHPVVPVHASAFHAARPAGAPPAPSPTLATATSWLTTYAPTATGCSGCSGNGRWTMSPGNSKRWCDCAKTTSRPKPRPATSSAPYSMPTGQAPSRSSRGWPRRSPVGARNLIHDLDVRFRGFASVLEARDDRQP